MVTTETLQSLSHPTVLAVGEMAQRPQDAETWTDLQAVRAAPALAENLRLLMGGVPAKGCATPAHRLRLTACGPREALGGMYADTKRDDFKTALDISAYSLLALMQRLMPLLEKHGASVISLSYLAAERAVPMYNVMGSAKAVLEQTTRQLAYELGPRGIRVNAISAGPVNTLAARGIKNFNEKLKEGSNRSALRRGITQEEVGKAALFLLSDMSSGITGEIMYVDAGFNVVAG